MALPVTTIIPGVVPRFTNADGTSLAGGKLFTYAAGTTTKTNSRKQLQSAWMQAQQRQLPRGQTATSCWGGPKGVSG